MKTSWFPRRSLYLRMIGALVMYFKRELGSDLGLMWGKRILFYLATRIIFTEIVSRDDMPGSARRYCSVPLDG